MTRIFISHAAADKELVDPFVDTVVRLGCGVPSESIFYSSGADTGVPTGMDLNAYVRDRVSDDGLVVALITPTFQRRPYCLAELGAAWSRVDNLFPLAAPELAHEDMEGVLAGLVVRSFDDSAALDELHDRVCKAIGCSTDATTWGSHKAKWLKTLKNLTVPSPQLFHGTSKSTVSQNGTKKWGHLFDSFVDAAFYAADDSVARDQIVHHLESRTLVPGRYLYSSDLGAANWIRLCQDPAYRHHHETVEFWAGPDGKAIAALIGDRLGHDFDYVSLGPGDGKKDAHLVAYWLESETDIIYYPYDVSLALVSRAIRKVRNKVMNTGTERLHIKAVLADFDHLNAVSEVLSHRSSPNVVALLGNSLGNLENELEFLRELKQQMSSEDIFVLEVRLKSADEQLPELATREAMHFDFGALEHYLGLTFNPGQMTVDEHVTRISSIPKTSTTVVGCKDITFRNESYDEIKLIYIHEYTQQDFLAALEDVGFEVIDSRLGQRDASFLVCVVRPKSDETRA